MRTCALAVTVHDPGANFLPGLQRLGSVLPGVFAAGAAVLTSRTEPQVVGYLEGNLGWATETVEPDGRVGLHRRMAVSAALAADTDVVLYSDLDHVLRWLEAAPGEIARVVEMDHDLVIVGRSEVALQQSPRRLRDTERLINHLYELVTGDGCDVMFALRCMSRAAASRIVAHCQEDSAGNDVEWPLHLRTAGYSIGCFHSDHLEYRDRRDFDAPSDERDLDPAQWIRRIEMASGHAQVFKRFLAAADPAE
jgi:hypothetical protein